MKATCSRSLVATVVVATLSVCLVPGTALAAETVSILGVAWTPTPNPALVVSASGPLRYTESRPAAGVLVVQFPDATPSGVVAPVSEPAAGLDNAILAIVEEGGVKATRLRIEFDPAARVTVNALPAGIEVRFEKAEKNVAQVQELLDVLAVADGTGVTINLASHGRIEGRTFTLADPPRVVVDLRGVVNRVAKREHPVGAEGVRRVRVAQFATSPEPVVRVVVDLESDLPYRLESTEHGALVRIGKEPPTTVATVQTTPSSPPAVAPAEQPQPTQVADVVPAGGGLTPAPPIQLAPTASEPTHAAHPATQPESAAAVPVSPVKIVDVPALEPSVSASVPSVSGAQDKRTPPAQERTEAVSPATQAPLTTPPGAAAAESPFTTTQAAMAEQASPPTAVTTITRQVETQEHRFTGEPISLEMKDADIKDVLRTFSKITGLNIVIDPGVSGSVTVQLENVPWDQALDIILRINKLDFIVENNVLRVAQLSVLTQEKQAVSQYKKEEEATKPMRTVTKTVSYATAAQIRGVLTQQNFILSDRGSVVIDERTNQLIIRDSADRIEGILNLIDSLDQPNFQVIIEARIVETTRTFARQLGMNWGIAGVKDAAHGNTTGWSFPYSINGPYQATSIGTSTGLTNAGGGQVSLGGTPTQIGGGAISMVFSDILNAFNLDFTLSAAESNGLAKIISSPKVLTQNNTKAHIQSGVQVPIQTVANNTVTVQYIDATLSLDVTPQITAEGTVMLDIDIKKREPLAGVNITGGSNIPLSTRDAKTKLLVRDGGTTVIGGIYQFSDNDSRNAVPGLSSLPLIGALFRTKSVSQKHDELLIFITPRIVKY